jgi:hypothetical protein
MTSCYCKCVTASLRVVECRWPPPSECACSIPTAEPTMTLPITRSTVKRDAIRRIPNDFHPCLRAGLRIWKMMISAMSRHLSHGPGLFSPA